jgi:arginine deiminase
MSEHDHLCELLEQKDAEIAGLQDELKIAAGKTDVQAYDRMLQELAEKDGENARMNAWIGEAMTTMQTQKAEIVRLKEENSAIENQAVEYAGQLLENDAEIKRLKGLLRDVIPYLAIHFTHPKDCYCDRCNLLQQARKATK